jgi:hypothetical protein
MQERCAAAFERLEIDRFIIRCASLPTPIEDANPFEGQGPHSGLMCLALLTLLLVIDLCPEGMPDRFRRPLHERLSQELRTLEAPMHPGFLAAAFRDRRDARIFLEFLGRSVAFSLFAKGHEEAGSKDGPGAWQGIKQGEVRMVLGVLCDGFIEVSDHPQGDTELGDEGLYQEGIGSDEAVIGGQGCGTLNGLEAFGDKVGRAHVVFTEEGLKSGAACKLHRFEGGPAAQEVAKERRIFLLKPLQDMREVVFECTGKTIGETDFVADETTTGLNKLRQGAHGGALGGERGELVAMFEEEIDLEFRIGGVVFGPTGGKRFTVFGEGERIDRKEHEEIIVAQCGHNGPFIKLKAHGNALSIEPRTQGLDPPIDCFRAVLEDPQLSSLRASGLYADIVFGISPVETNEGGKFLLRYMFHVSPPRVC